MLCALLTACEWKVVVIIAFILQDIPIPTLKEIFHAMKKNTHVVSLSIAATRSNDPVAYVSITSYISVAYSMYNYVVLENLPVEVVAEL